MKKWLCWQFVLPRAVAVVVTMLAAQYVLGIVARSIAIQSGEALTGGQIEVDHARVSLGAKKVVLSGIRVAASAKSSKSVLEADRCELTFSADRALHKQAVIESGRVSGLRFNGFDETTNAAATATADSNAVGWFKRDVDAAAQKWLERLNSQLTLDAVDDFASVTRAETFCANWSKQSPDLESRLQELDTRAAELQQSIETAEANPLRNEKALQDLRQKMADVQQEFTALQAEIDKLPDVLEAGRRTIVAARRQDDEAASKRLHVDAVEANSLSAYLLQDEATRQLNQLVSWVRWMRETTPADSKTVRATRGENVLFAGCQPEPGLLIRSLQLAGSIRLAGQPIELRGVLLDLASTPRLHNAPTRLHLVGSGSCPLEVKATIDRTRAIPRDEWIVDCQGILLRGMTLGKANQLGISLAPSVGTISMSLSADGDKLNGEVQIVQQRVQMTPAYQGNGGEALTAAMSDTLGSVSSIATRLSLGGTIEQPTCTLWSNLGTAVAESVERAVRRTGDQHAKALLAEAGRRVDERLTDVDRQLAERQAEFASKTTAISARLQKIAANESPRYRISAEKGGRRLPSNSLFR